MRRIDHPSVSLSGVPQVFDRFGMIDALGPGIVDPLAAARGVSRGLVVGLSLWIVIGFATGVI